MNTNTVYRASHAYIGTWTITSAVIITGEKRNWLLAVWTDVRLPPGLDHVPITTRPTITVCSMVYRASTLRRIHWFTLQCHVFCISPVFRARLLQNLRSRMSQLKLWNADSLPQVHGTTCRRKRTGVGLEFNVKTFSFSMKIFYT